jgi:hypothetical protein
MSLIGSQGGLIGASGVSGGPSGDYFLTTNTADFNSNVYATLAAANRILTGVATDSIYSGYGDDQYWGNCPGMPIGGAVSYPYRGLIKFDFSQLPAGGTISAVELGGRNTSWASTTTYNIYALTRAYATAAHTGTCAETNQSTAVSWNQYSGTSTWTTAGGDYSATLLGSFTINGDPAWRTVTAANLLTYVQTAYATPAGDYGIIIMSSNEGANSSNALSSDIGTDGARVYLKVTF